MLSSWLQGGGMQGYYACPMQVSHIVPSTHCPHSLVAAQASPETSGSVGARGPLTAKENAQSPMWASKPVTKFLSVGCLAGGKHGTQGLAWGHKLHRLCQGMAADKVPSTFIVLAQACFVKG